VVEESVYLAVEDKLTSWVFPRSFPRRYLSFGQDRHADPETKWTLVERHVNQVKDFDSSTWTADHSGRKAKQVVVAGPVVTTSHDAMMGAISAERRDAQGVQSWSRTRLHDGHSVRGVRLHR